MYSSQHIVLDTTMSTGNKRRLGEDPPTADLPGLFPTHDGSYGINTLINVEPSLKRGRRSRATGIANEEDEDMVFRRRLRGRDGRRFDTQGTVEEVLGHAVEEAAKNPDTAALPLPVTSATDTATTTTATKPFQVNPLYTATDPAGRAQGPHIPQYNDSVFPAPITATTTTATDIYTGGTQGQFSIIGNRKQGVSPFDPLPPSYGMPTGRGSSLLWSSPSRPDSSRSFNAESGLFGDADLRTPLRDPNARDLQTGLTAAEAMDFRLTGRLPANHPPDRPAAQQLDPSIPTAPLPRFLDPKALDAASSSVSRVPAPPPPFPPPPPQNTQTATQQITQPATKPLVQPATKPPAQPVTKPPVQPVVQPAIQPVVQPAVQPAVQPVTGPATKPASRRSSQSSYGLSDHGSPVAGRRTSRRGSAVTQAITSGGGGGGGGSGGGSSSGNSSYGRSNHGSPALSQGSGSATGRLANFLGGLPSGSTSTPPPPPVGLTAHQTTLVNNLVRGMKLPPVTRSAAPAPSLASLAGLSLPEINATRKMVLSMARDPADVKNITDALDQAALRLNTNYKPPTGTPAGSRPPSVGNPPSAPGTPAGSRPPSLGNSPSVGIVPKTPVSGFPGLTASEVNLVSNLVMGMRLPARRTRNAPPVPPLTSLASMTVAEIDAVKRTVSRMSRSAASIKNITDALDQAKQRLTGVAAIAAPPSLPGSSSSSSSSSGNNTPGSSAPGTPRGPAPPLPPVVPPRGAPPPPGPRRRVTRALNCYNIFKALLALLLSILVLVFLFRGIKAASEMDIHSPDLPKIHWQDGLSTAKQYTIDPLSSFWSSITNYSSSSTGSPGVLKKKKGSITERQLRDLEKKIPESVVVDKDKDGKPKISQDFWHALKERTKADDVIPSLEDTPGGKLKLSEDNLRDIKVHLEKDGKLGLGTKDDEECCGVTGDEVENMIDKSLSRSWGQWLEQNEENLKKTITGVAVTRDEFMDLLRKEVKSYQPQIKKEMEGMDVRIKNLISEITKLQKSTASLSGTSKEEIKALVKATVKKVVDNAVFDAMANGQIKGHASNVLFNQVNFFGIGSGAVIDPQYTSTVWQAPKNHLGSKGFLDRDGKRPLPPAAALLAWTEEGECFCAGSNFRGTGAGTNTLSILTARNIIPQHLVVEHILPGATLDPGAMPREIEVWAGIRDVKLRKEVEGFSKENFPNTPPEIKLDESYVKIGHFTYENKTYGDGVQVFKMQDQLVAMNAFTDHVVVRAINNYGADHTCFYQVKMYGEAVEHQEDPKHPYVRSGWF